MIGGILFILIGLISIIGAIIGAIKKKLPTIQVGVFIITHALLLAAGIFLLYHSIPWFILVFLSLLALLTRIWNGLSIYGRVPLTHQIANASVLSISVVLSFWRL